jgi:large subunit ribosomal protein L22
VQQKEGFGGDVERLFVSKCHADNGPSLKRVRPAPMGRAFRIVKRTTHLTVEVTERPQVVAAVGTEATGAKTAKAPKPAAKAKAAKTAKKTATGKAGGARAKKAAAKRTKAATR